MRLDRFSLIELLQPCSWRGSSSHLRCLWWYPRWRNGLYQCCHLSSKWGRSWEWLRFHGNFTQQKCLNLKCIYWEFDQLSYNWLFSPWSYFRLFYNFTSSKIQYAEIFSAVVCYFQPIAKNDWPIKFLHIYPKFANFVSLKPPRYTVSVLYLIIPYQDIHCN